MQRIKKNDTVVIIAGRYKGLKAKVLEIMHETDRIRVQGIDSQLVVKRHLKANVRPNQPQGGIIEIPATVHISNVMLWDEESQKGTRVGYASKDDERKVRISKRTGKQLD